MHRPQASDVPSITASDPGSLTPRVSPTGPPAPCARVIPKAFDAKPGLVLFDGVMLGRQLGAGVQAKIFDLVRSTDGSSIGKVLKLGHKTLNASFLAQFAGSMMDLEHEWQLGMQLKAALELPDGSLPGFTRTCDCVVMLQDPKSKTGVFTGMIMERLNGWTIHKRIMDPAFHNIHYVREMLFQVFSALDRAQRALGFNHADLGLNNVMEVYPRLFPEVVQGEQAANAAAISASQHPTADANGDCIACRSSDDEPMHHRRTQSAPWRRSQQGAGCAAPAPVVGYSVGSDGDLAALGPHIEFKIIDYGVGEFNEVLAQAAGGHEPEETLRRIQSVFEMRGIPIGPGKRHGASRDTEHDQDADQEEGDSVNEPGDMSTPSSTTRGEINLVNEDGDVPSGRWKLRPFGAGNRFVVGVAGPGKAAQEPPRSTPSTLRAASMARGPVESMYRKFWERKGDVFHLLLALALALDDRVWPKEDERYVQLLVSLIYHVTGIKMRAYFASANDPKRFKVMGKRHKRSKYAGGKEPVFGARVRCFAAFRRLRILWAAHTKPFNSGLLAGEALVSPFFGLQGAPHAELPVCVEAAFPPQSIA